MTRNLSVVVPAYKSASTLARLVSEVATHVGPLVDDYEIVFVDDGSGDGTWAEIQALSAREANVSGMSLSRNYGQHNALLAGIRAAKFELVLTIDDDLQCPPSEVDKLLAALTDDIDLVYGAPRELPHNWFRNMTSRLAKGAMSMALGPDVQRRATAFRVFRKHLIHAADRADNPFISIEVLLTWATTRIAVVDVEFASREEGTSGYTVPKLIRHALNMITGYSTRPLRFVSALGLCMSAFGFALLTFVVVRYLTAGSTVAGFTFLAAAIATFSGVQLLCLGIVGEYLGQMHFRSMGRPTFVVRETTAAGTNHTESGQQTA